MLRRACLSALLGMVTCAIAEPAGQQPLSSEQIREAEFLEGLSIPNPGEIFAAFGKLGKPDWTVHFRRQPPAPSTTRALIALNLGVRIADGFLAAEAQDRQQVKNVSREIRLLAKSLGLEQEFLVRSNSIADFADNRRWDALDEEIEAVQAELAAAMDGRHDSELAMLMSLGCWLRSVDIASAQLGGNYTPEAATMLRVPTVAEFFSTRMDMLPGKIRTLPSLAEIRHRLPALAAALTPSGALPPSREAVSALHHLAAALITLITAPEK